LLGLATSGNVVNIVTHIIQLGVAFNKKDAENTERNNVILKLFQSQTSIMKKLQAHKTAYRGLFANLSTPLSLGQKKGADTWTGSPGFIS
jgi:hypothetical protein